MLALNNRALKFSLFIWFSGYHTISQRHDRPDEDDEITTTPQDRETVFSMPELMHNLNILVDMAEEDIIQNDRKYENLVVFNI